MIFPNQNTKIIGRYTLKDIKESNYLTIKLPLTSSEIINFRHIKNNTTITFSFTNQAVTDEAEYILNVIAIFSELAKSPNHYNIIINITNRELLRQSKLLSKKPANVSLSIKTDEYIYSVSEYKKEEEKIQSMIEPIKAANLSPFEKYLAVYDIVKGFKQYHKSEDDHRKDRELRFILDDNNPYIVCAGFAALLNELLSRVNIHSKYITTDVDFSDKITPMPIELEYVGHARNLVKIDDDKYHIHGIYLADTTWDNHPNWNLYTNSILTFDRKKEARHLEALQDEDLLLDFHNIDEFTNKIRYYIKRKTSFPNIDKATEEKMRVKSYKDLYAKIMEILFSIDKPAYKELYDKYHDLFSFDTDHTTSKEAEAIVTPFLIDYAKYIIPLSNNTIEYNSVINALITIKGEVYHWNNDKIQAWLTKTINDNIKAEMEAFPYQYDPENKTEAYVEERKNRGH